jgi:organic radical activating enzyme
VKPKVQGLTYDEGEQTFKIRELEVSITSKCHLRCDNCGFYIPQQPNPSSTDNIVSEIVNGLSQLQRLNIKVGSLGVLGGEPTFNQKVLETALKEFSKFDNIERIEVVSHGLTPQNISKEILQFIDKLTISIYFESEELTRLWKIYLDKFAPHIELSLRTDKDWDKWLGSEVADDSKAQEMFDYCWYRKHCVTLERQRLFMCSRIAKLSQDHEGIILNEQTSLDDINKYLNQNSFIASCKTCTPMMGLATIKAGQQPDDRILKMLPTAIIFLKAELNEQP